MNRHHIFQYHKVSKYWSRLLTLYLLLTATFGITQVRDKIDPKLLIADPSKLQDIVVVLNKQADISAVKSIHGKDNKATFVFDALLKTAENSQEEVKGFLKGRNIGFRSFYIVNMISLKANRDLITRLAALPSVREVIEDGRFMMIEPVPAREKTDARAIEWNVTKINAPSVWALGFTGQNVVIGGQDTGYEWDDPCLKGKYRGWNGTTANHDYNWHDAIHENNPMSPGTNSCGFNSPVPCDDNNHGTHTMGTMVGDDGLGNQIGVAPGAKWIGCRNMENGYGTLTTYTECFEWFLAPYPVSGTPSQGNPLMMPHVINNSWGCPPVEGCNNTNWSVMETALNNLRNAGCVIVVSAGNSGSACSTVSDPAAIFDGSYTVGATNSSDTIANFSSRGPVTVDNSGRMKPDVSAPGEQVRSCIRGANNFGTWNGTSMAGPHVAAAVALLISANPSLAGEVDKIEEILSYTSVHLTSTENCTTPGSNIPNNTFGFGRINVLDAVNMALASNYTPYVKQNTSIVIDNASKGLILASPSGTLFSVKTDNAGIPVATQLAGVSSNPVKVTGGSFNLEPLSTGIILKSPSGNYWQLGVTNSGAVTTSALATLPATYSIIQANDLYIEHLLKGVLLRSPDNTCYLVHMSNLGKLIAIPANCVN